MVISAILVALLATMGQWWFFGPVTKCLVYPLTTGLLTGIFMGDPMTGMLAGANIQLIYLGWISAGGTMPSNTIVAGDLRHGDDDSFRRKPDHGGDICHSVQYVRTLTEPGLYDRKLFLDPQG